MNINTKKDYFEIQKAIKFLTEKLLDHNGDQIPLHTDKPLVIHSLRTGFILLDYGYEKDIVIAGILHDLNEDAEVSFSEIEKLFGNKVRKIVQAVSYDRTIENDRLGHQDLHDREKAAGQKAIVVSIADHLANFPFLKYAATLELQKKILKRWQTFLNKVAVAACEEPIFRELKKKLLSVRLDI